MSGTPLLKYERARKSATLSEMANNNILSNITRYITKNINGHEMNNDANTIMEIYKCCYPSFCDHDDR
mgnify:CR=1 FL=1